MRTRTSLLLCSLLLIAVACGPRAGGRTGRDQDGDVPERDELDEASPEPPTEPDDELDEAPAPGDPEGEPLSACGQAVYDLFDALLSCDRISVADMPTTDAAQAACDDPANSFSECWVEARAVTACRAGCDAWGEECSEPWSDFVRCHNHFVGSCELGWEGYCDEPEGLDLCPEGTDATDCATQTASGEVAAVDYAATCEWTNDGVCDEPEGTGICLDGTDPEDCAEGAGGGEEPEPPPGCDPATCNDSYMDCGDWGCVACAWWCADDVCQQSCSLP